jgi:hypothetical protein
MADIDRVKRNIQRMIKMNAEETEVDEYIASEGVTLDQVRAHKVGSAAQPDAAETERRKAGFFDNSEQQAKAEAMDLRVAKERSEMSPAWRGTRDVLRNVASGGTVLGVPLGSWADEANSAISDVTNRVTGGKMGEPYQDRMDYHAAYDRAAENDSVKLGTLPVIGEVSGGDVTQLASGVASSLAAPQSLMRAFVTRPGQTGAAAGAIYGSGQGQGGDRVTNALMGGAMGFAVGKAAPWVGKRVSNTTNYLMDKVRPRPPALAGYEPGAVDRVLAAADDSELFGNNLTSNYYTRTGELGPEAMLGDMSDRLRGQLYAVGTTPGESQRVVRNALMPRQADALGRIETTLDASMGKPLNLVTEQKRVLGQANSQAAPYYDAFRNKVLPVSPGLRGVIDRAMAAKNGQSSILALADRKAAIQGAPVLDWNGQQITGRQIDYLKRALDDVAYDKATPRDDARLFKELLADLKAAVNDRDWEIARNMASSGQQFRQGVEEGAGAFKRATNPDQQAADIAAMNPVQRGGYFAGARGSVRDTIYESGTKFGSNADSAAMKLFGTENGQRRLGNVTSPQGARDISNRVKAEVEFAKTNEAVYGNSATEKRQIARKEFPNPVDKGLTDVPASVEQAVFHIGKKIAAATRNENLNEASARIALDAARLLTAQGARRDVIAAALRRLSRSKGASAQAARLLGEAAEGILRGSLPSAVGAVAAD